MLSNFIAVGAEYVTSSLLDIHSVGNYMSSDECGGERWFCGECFNTIFGNGKKLGSNWMKAVIDAKVQETVQMLDKPTWFKELVALLDDRFMDIDRRVNTNIDLLAADLSNFKVQVEDQILSLNSAETEVEDLSSKSPLRKRKMAVPSSHTMKGSVPVSSVPVRNSFSCLSSHEPVLHDDVPQQQYVANRKTTPVSYKAALKLDSSNPAANVSVLKKLNSLKNKNEDYVNDFNCKSSKNGSLNIMFKS